MSKYKALWHPEHRPAASCVTPEPATVSAPSTSTSAPPPPKPEPPEPSHSGVLHTLEEIMKCRGVSPAAPAVRIEEKNQTRGVRGEEARFPQERQHDSLDSVVHLEHYQPLSVLPPSASPEERAAHEIREAYRQCVFELRWPKQQRDDYIARAFEGRRFYQLTLDEQQLLVYRLRTLLLSDT